MTSQAQSTTRSRRRRLHSAAPLSLVLAGSLLLAGCAQPEPRGSGDLEALDGVSLSIAEDGSPEVSVDGAIEAEETSSRVLKDGDGEEIDNGDLVLVQTAVVDPSSGEVQADNFTQGSEAVFVDDQLQQGNQVLYDMLEQNKVGAQVAFFMPASQLGQSGGTGNLMVFQITGKAPQRAEGEPVEVTDETLPEISIDESTGEPTIAKPEGDAPQDLVTQTLIEGDGDTVGEQDYVTVRYKGVKWSDGEEFDSDWERGTPTGFGLNQVITGWTEGLSGQKVGSQVLLVAPPSKAYGESEGNDLQEETLVFVVDILHTMPPAEAEPAAEDADTSEESSDDTATDQPEPSPTAEPSASDN